MAKKIPNIETFKEALEKSFGIISVAAKSLGVSRSTVYNTMKKYPELKETIEENRNRIIDLAESALVKKITCGDTTAIIFLLKTLGKNRGYIEKQQVEQETTIKTIPKLEIIVKK